jgi:c-di-GMP-binding flagellar brake protein YcgR
MLTDKQGDSYDAFLENISLGGALVKVSSGVPVSLQVGGECGLMLFNKSDSRSSNHTCRVVRHDSVNMGIRFFTP